MINPLTLPQAVVDGLAVLPALLTEAQAANRTLAEALERADRIDAQADRLIAQADKILATAHDAREVLDGAQAELARANDQVAKIIEMGGPLERGVDRLDRIVSKVRRDTQEGTGEAP